jgi:hypothetical protein
VCFSLTRTVSAGAAGAAAGRRGWAVLPARSSVRHPSWILDGMTTSPRMVFLGFGKFARADKIYALEPLRGDERGEGRRTRVWVEGMPSPIVASRTERTILQDMGDEAAAQAPIVADALELARRLADAADAGRVDLGDLGRRARRLLEASTSAEQG